MALVLLSDPWHWTVEEVIAVLTDANSPLLLSNAHLSLPAPNSLSYMLRRHDVTGLALLTMLNNECLRDELGIASLGQRAGLRELIRELRTRSAEYQQKYGQLGQLSREALIDPELSAPSSHQVGRRHGRERSYVRERRPTTADATQAVAQPSTRSCQMM